MSKRTVVLLFVLIFTFFSNGNSGTNIFGTDIAQAKTSFKSPVIYSLIGGQHEVKVFWTPVADAMSYRVYYGTSSGVYGSPVNISRRTTYILPRLESATTYYVAVTALYRREESPKSQEKSVATLGGTLSAPVLNTAIGANRKVTLNWSPVDGASRYRIYFHSSQSRFGRIVDVNNSTTHTVKWLRSGTTYFFKVSAMSAGHKSPQSNEKSALTLPRAPWIYSAVGDVNKVDLKWSPTASATSYKVYYGTSRFVYEPSIDVGNTTSYSVTGLAGNTKYYFAVTAVNSTGEGRKSFPRKATTLSGSLLAPTLNAATGGQKQVVLNWSTVAEATTYKIYYGTVPGVYGAPVNAGNVTQFTVTGLDDGTVYYFAVTAVNSTQESSKSNEQSAKTIAVLPTASITINPTSMIQGESAQLSWECTNSDTCEITPNIGAVASSGTMSISPTATTDYTITATGPGGSVTNTASITVAIPPTASITINPESITLGQPATLSWQCTNSDTCEITPNIGAVASSGTMNISPTATTDYTITATGPGGIVTNTASITVAIAPTASITIDPESITLGQPATLSWQCTNADTCTITPGIGAVDSIGTMSVSPSTSTTYTLTATSPNGTDSKSTTLIVAQLKPTVTLSSNASTIPSGSSATLTWNSTNAASLYIDNNIGPVADSGTVSVSPTATTTYTITTTGPLGSANASVTVHVSGAPEIPPAGTFGEQYKLIIPPDATVEKYAADRFAVIRGEVKDKNNVPLAQVSVVVKGQPQYGTGQTDTNGQFSLPVDRNGTLTLTFKKSGFLTTHRNVQVASNDIAIAETIQMLAEDSKATEIDLNGNADNVIVHQSTPVSDVSGTRQANVVISGDNQAFAVDEHGQDMFELTKLNIRATEFTTPESMPAALPPTSAFTYCVELKADGVDRVRFKDPVVVYVDNFLGFDVGEIVPVGYYDRDRGVWVASDNGRVVKLLDLNADGTVDALDSNGDGNPDDLNNNQDYSDEVKGLNDSTKYSAGKTFWRVSLTHFTPWDCNWPMFIWADAISPNATGPGNVDQKKDLCKDDNKTVNSYVNCRSRIYNEDIDIPGTGLTLHYASNQVADYKNIITVPASGATVPASLQKIIVRLTIAGRTFVKILPATANQTAEFSWDGLDYLGKRVDSATAHITTEFIYQLMYSTFGGGARPAVFGLPGVSQSPVPARDEYIYSKGQSIVVHNQSQTRPSLVEGWTLSNHHYMSSSDVNTLYKGNGDLTSNDEIYVITTIAGSDVPGYSGDGGSALAAKLSNPFGVAVDQSRNIYIADSYNNRIRKIDANGIITTIAGAGPRGYSGDGGLAIMAKLDTPLGVTVDQNGNIYFADGYNQRIRKVDTNGIITTIAGTGVAGFSGDGGLATAAQMNSPEGVAVDQSGNIYVADTLNYRVCKIDSNGIMTTIAGTDYYGYSGDGGPATAARLFYPMSVTVDQSGNIYIADWGENRIRKIDLSGIITTIVGTGVYGYSGDGGPATSAQLSSPSSVAVDQNGNIYVADMYNARIRKIDANGIITTVVGTGVSGYNGDNIRSTAAMLNQPMSVTVDHNGDIYISDSRNHRIRKVMAATAFIFAHIGDMTFVEEGLGYVFSLEGKHKQTIDLDTQKVIEQFAYDSAGRLISVTDLFNNQITIERNSSGVPTAIVSPDGIRTNLTINANNHLTQITYPDGTYYKFDYTSGGLLTKETEPKGNFFTHTFDANGRITDVQDQEGGHEHFTRQVAPNSGDLTTTITSGEGDVVTYLDKTAPNGDVTSTSSVSGVTKPLIYTRSADDLTSKIILPDLTIQDLHYALDPEYKFKYLQSATTTLPSGLKSEIAYTRTYTDTNVDGKKDLITHTALTK
jgi:YD repeat-containing protein